MSDTILAILWILLSLTGIVLQLYDTRDRTRTPFPAPSTCSSRRRPRIPQRVGYDSIIREPTERLVGPNTRQRNRRWNPVPSAPERRQEANDRTADERSSLLYPNYNIYGPRPATPPPDYIHVTNANRREYQPID